MKANNYRGVLPKPIGSGFKAASTSTEMIEEINLHGKIAIVTAEELEIDGGLTNR
jgi:hypothetical protein